MGGEEMKMLFEQSDKVDEGDTFDAALVKIDKKQTN